MKWKQTASHKQVKHIVEPRRRRWPQSFCLLSLLVGQFWSRAICEHAFSSAVWQKQLWYNVYEI